MPCVVRSERYLLFLVVSGITLFYFVLMAGNNGGLIGKPMYMGTTNSPKIQSEFLVINGTVDESGKIVVYPLYSTRNIAVQDCSGDGEFSIELDDIEGNVLFSSFFGIEKLSVIQKDGSDIEMDSGQFLFKIPFYEKAVRISIKKESKILWKKVKSKNVPNVSLINPKNGEIIETDKINIAIEAGDKDSDKLYFLLEYSSDDGDTWNALTGLFTDRILNINSSNLTKDKNIILCLLCTDGFNTQRDNVSVDIMY